MQTEPLQITNLYNAGLLIRHRGAGYLIDALFDKGLPGLSAPPPGLLEALLTGEGEFTGIDYVLTSHSHGDHYSPNLTARYLRGRPLRGVFLPHGARLPETEAPLLDPGSEAICSFAVPNGRITAFSTRHLGAQYRDVAHYSFLLELGGRSVFVAADAGAQDNDFIRLLSHASPEIFFVTPLFPAHSTGRAALRELHPRRVGVYHIPREPDDLGGYRTLLSQVLERHGADLQGLTAFWNPPQTVLW